MMTNEPKVQLHEIGDLVREARRLVSEGGSDSEWVADLQRKSSLLACLAAENDSAWAGASLKNRGWGPAKSSGIARSTARSCATRQRVPPAVNSSALMRSLLQQARGTLPESPALGGSAWNEYRVAP